MDNQALQQIATIIRGLAIDGVEAANSGHPGMPMGMADVASILWTDYLRHHPANPHWFNRDRFVLSAGHGSMLLYSLLHLYGYNVAVEDLRHFRQWMSKTPGHPEVHYTPGVETTTGPLGQGISTAVGMALAEVSLAARFNREGHNIVDHYTYVIASDGDLQEGISHEASAFAGHNRLSKLIVLYDDNGISIDGKTELSFSEDVLLRYEAYGWHTQRVNGHDYDAVRTAIDLARKAGKPSIIACRTTIGYGSPNKGGTKDVHGSPLGKEEAALSKQNLGLPVDQPFYTPDEVLQLTRKALEDGKQAEEQWNQAFQAYREAYPELAAQLQDAIDGRIPEEVFQHLPEFPAGKPIATRAASGKTLDAISAHIPALIGGSADLTPSNNTLAVGETSFSPANPAGRYIRYGVREHGMAAIMNGMALHGGVIPFGGTFFVFTDYMRGSMRLSAIMEARVIYVLTHDSIGLGEDGPTHQPIEHLASLRAMPQMTIIRPCDANETAVAWQMALQNGHGPTGLVLTRQNLPVYERDGQRIASARLARHGAYVLMEDEDYQAIIIATGSEVEIAVNAKELLNAEGIGVRVVSMPSAEVFDRQDGSYREQVLPSSCRARVAVEAGATLSWYKYTGLDGRVIGLDHFGASAPYQRLYKEFGLTAEKVADAVREVVGAAKPA